MTNKPKDKQSPGGTDFGTNTVKWQRVCVLHQKNAITSSDFFFIKVEGIPMTYALICFILILCCILSAIEIYLS